MKLKVFFADCWYTSKEVRAFLQAIPGVSIERTMLASNGFIVDVGPDVPLQALYAHEGIVSVSQFNQFRSWSPQEPT